MQVAIFTNFKTVHSHYNSSSSHHSTKIIVILSESIAILPLLLVKRIFGIFIWKPKEYSNTKITIRLSPNVQVPFGNTCISNSQVIAQGKAEYNFDWYVYENTCECLLITHSDHYQVPEIVFLSIVTCWFFKRHCCSCQVPWFHSLLLYDGSRFPIIQLAPLPCNY